MKKYIFGAVLSLGILASPAFTQAAALTSSQISAIVSLLQSFGADQATINSVQISLNGGTPTTGGGTGAWCYTFHNDMTVGYADKGDSNDVSALNRALVLSGIIDGNRNNNIFDEDNAAEVGQFQAKYGIRQTGYVGLLTRAKLNSLYGCSPNFPPTPPPFPPFPPLPPQPSITVLSPTAGTAVIQGWLTTISWQSTGNANANYVVGESVGSKSSIGTFSASQAHCDTADKCFISWVPTITSSSIRISIYDSVSGRYGASEAFAIVAPTTFPPSITVLSPNGGETWMPGNAYNINWKASGFEKVSINLIDYSCSSEIFNPIVSGISASQNSYSWTVPSNFFEARAGTYCPSNSYINNPTTHYGWRSGDNFKIFIGGLKTDGTFGSQDESDASFSIVAGTTTTVTPITLTNISPASGPVGTSIRLDGCGSDSSSGFTLVYTGPKSGSASIPVETLGAASGCGYMTITVPADFPAGTYILSVKNNQTGAMSTNGEAFTVTAPVVANNPYVSLSATSITQGGSFTGSITGAAPNTQIRIFSKGPDGVTAEDTPGTTSSTGTFSRTYTTTGWTAGSYQSWVTVNGVQSNVATFTVTAPVATNNPVASVSSTSFVAGAIPFGISITGAAPNTQIRIFSTGPDGVTSEDTPGTTNPGGQFSRTYNTTGWAAGSYRGWVTVNGVQSNVVTFNVGTGVTTTAPVVSLSSSSTVQGGMFVVSVSGVPNAAVKIFCRDPNGVSCDDAVPGTTDANGKFSRSYTTSGWTLGTYKGWVTVNGVQLNTVGFIITASVGLSGGASQTASVFNAVGGSVLGNSTSQAPATTFTYV